MRERCRHFTKKSKVRHSGDSVSVIWDNGNCIVGDLEPIMIPTYDLQQPFCSFAAYFVNDDNLCHLPK